jgi:hypothetical protein
MPEYSVVLFHSAAHVIRGEKVLTRAGVTVKMIPTPRQISTDCGMALRFFRDESERVSAILAENEVPIKGIHPLS